MASDKLEPLASVLTAALLTVISIVLCLVIAWFTGGREPFPLIAIFCGATIVTCWAVTLSFAALITVVRCSRAIRREVAVEKGLVPAGGTAVGRTVPFDGTAV